MQYKINRCARYQNKSVGQRQNYMKRFEIVTLTSLVSEGKKIACLSGNRDFDKKIVKTKMKSLEKCRQLMPAVVVDATDAINQGLEVVDFATGDVIGKEEAVNYLVLVEGNHRYAAHCGLLAKDEKYTSEFYVMYALNVEVTIAKMLSEINIATNPWKGRDFVKGAKMSNPHEELPLLDAMNDLTKEEFSLTAASKWLTFTPKVNKHVMDNAINGIILDELKNTSGLERGQRLLEAAKVRFMVKDIKARTLINWIISKYEATDNEEKADFTDKMERFLRSISKEDADYIKNAKGETGGDTKENIINQKLTELWGNFEG